jgi:hypothetical protein
VFSKKFSTTTEGSNKVSFVTEPPSSEFPDDPFEGDKETTDEDGDPDEDLETSGSGSGDEDDELDMGLDNNEITASDEQKNDEELELEAESGSGSDGAHADGVRNHRGNRVAWQRAQRLRRLQAARRRNAKLKAQQRQKALQRKRVGVFLWNSKSIFNSAYIPHPQSSTNYIGLVLKQALHNSPRNSSTSKPASKYAFKFEKKDLNKLYSGREILYILVAKSP